MLVEATVKLDEQTKRIGRAVDDSKPYWEARKVARQVGARKDTRRQKKTWTGGDGEVDPTVTAKACFQRISLWKLKELSSVATLKEPSHVGSIFKP